LKLGDGKLAVRFFAPTWIGLTWAVSVVLALGLNLPFGVPNEWVWMLRVWKKWRAHLLMHQNFSAVQEHCPPENHSPVANRYLLPFQFGSSFAILFCPPTEVGGYENKAC